MQSPGLLEAMQVASHLHKGLEELGDMTVEELSLWLAFLAQHDPVKQQADLRACALGVALVPGRFKPELILGDDRGESPTPEELKRRAMAWCRGNRGSITRRNSK